VDALTDSGWAYVLSREEVTAKFGRELVMLPPEKAWRKLAGWPWW